MKRVVFCWEMGGNYGHTAGFLPIYKELKRQGVEIFCILRNTTYAHLLDNDPQTFCFQAPSPRFAPTKRELYSFTDILAYIGYTQEPILTRYLYDWTALLKHVNADLLIADHAPTALLAARILNMPSVAMGTGFTNPPYGENFPSFFPERQSPELNLNDHVLNVINQSLGQFKTAPLLKVGDIFDRSRIFLCTVSELDHYGSRHELTDYRGPLYSDEIGEVFKWPNNNEPKIFAYLTPKVKNLSGVLEHIVNLPGHKLLHIPSADIKVLSAVSQRSDVSIQTTPVHMRSLSEQVDLVINQGGLGLSSQCFIKGIKQVLIPTQTEQRMLARRVLVQKIALAVDPHLTNPPYNEIFNQALNSPELKQICSQAKLKYENFSQEKQVEDLVKDTLSCISD